MAKYAQSACSDFAYIDVFVETMANYIPDLTMLDGTTYEFTSDKS